MKPLAVDLSRLSAATGAPPQVRYHRAICHNAPEPRKGGAIRCAFGMKKPAQNHGRAFPLVDARERLDDFWSSPVRASQAL